MADDFNYQRRNLILNSDIDETSIKEIIDKIIDINSYDLEQDIEQGVGYKREPINLYITTGGGEVEQGLALYDCIKQSKTPVYTYALGKCYSIGVPIFLAGKKRFCYDNTIFMYHQLSAREPWLTVKQKENNLKVLIENMSQIRKIILKNTNINIKLLEDWDSKNQDFYINSKNALDFGIVHEIIGGE